MAGEVGVVLIIAPDQTQADVCLGYVEATFQQSPILSQLVAGATQRTIRLNTGISLEVRAADFRRLRGPTYIAIVADEVAFWLTSENSSNPDVEILNAVRPGLATSRGPMFLISSPYARRGELWRLYQKHFGPNGDPLVLVAQGSSRTFNPSLPQSVVDRAIERDPASAAAEFGAEFRRDIESFVSIESVMACVNANVFERPPQGGNNYFGFCDPSGGSADSMTLCVGHLNFEKQTVVVDALRECKPPFSPEAVVEQFCTLLQSYGVSSVTGDRYGGAWPVEQFAKFGVTYEPSAKAKSDLYTDLLPLLNSARIELLDHPRLISQLTNLERRTARGGRDTIDHPPGHHDDIANAVAGLGSFNNQFGDYDFSLKGWDPNAAAADVDGARAFRAARLLQHIARFG